MNRKGKKAKVCNRVRYRTWTRVREKIQTKLWAKVSKKIRDRVLDMVVLVRRRVGVNVFLGVKAEDWDNLLEAE